MEKFCLEHINQSMVLEFQKVLDQELVTTMYQPIIDIRSGKTLGYEALSRGPEDSLLNSPLVLLSIAELLNKTWELEQMLRIKALKNATFTKEALLFLNVDPNVVNDQKFKKGFTRKNLEQLNISPDSIVLELTERSAIKSYDDFKLVLNHYTDQGYSIAIDDAGTGYSGLKTLYEVFPKYMKIDMDFVRDIDSDNFKQAIVKSLIDTAKSTDIKTIAEGIETSEELRTLIRLGVDYGQGYFIQRPISTIKAIDVEVYEIIKRENDLLNQVQNFSEDYHYVHHIMNPIAAFEPTAKCKDVSDFLKENSATSTCIVNRNKPVGLITMHELNGVFAKQFGFSVYSQRPVELVMDKHPMIVDYYTPIHTVAKTALKRSMSHIYDDIIITKGQTYVGIVTMKDLLEYAINYEKNYAKELNPLTSLPGNVIINRVMGSIIQNDRTTCILYADLDNFKVYNDVYGFENGDKVIKLTADILKKMTKKYLPYTSFLGHIGGDDFIIVAHADGDTILKMCEDIITTFDTQIKSCFNAPDIERGHIEAIDRHGIKREYNLTSVSLGGLTGSLAYYGSIERLSEHLAIVKKESKRMHKSSIVINSI